MATTKKDNWTSIFSVHGVSLVNAKCPMCGNIVKHGSLALHETKVNTRLRGSDSWFTLAYHKKCSSDNDEWQKHFAQEKEEHNQSINKL